MELQIVSLETAILAKEVGFDWKTRAYFIEFVSGHIGNHYSDNLSNHNSAEYIGDNINFKQFISQPTQELLRKWLRDVHDRQIYIVRASDKEGLGYSVSFKSAFNISDYNFECFRTYEEALEIGLLNILRELKEKQNNNDKTK